MIRKNHEKIMLEGEKDVKKIIREIKKSNRKLAREIKREISKLMAKSGVWEYDELIKYDRLNKLIKEVEQMIKQTRREQYALITGLLISSGIKSMNTTAKALQGGKIDLIKKDKNLVKQELSKPWSGDTMKNRYNKGTINEIDRVRQSIVKGAMDGNYRNSLNGVEKAIVITATASAVSILVSEKTHIDKEIILKDAKVVEYNAILDSTTCDICSGRDGNRYKKEDAPELPAHTNCRCFYTPIE